MSDLNRRLYRYFKQRIDNHRFMQSVPRESGISIETERASNRIHTKYIVRLNKAVRYLNHRLSR